MNRRSFLERALVMGTGAAVAQAGKSAAQNDAPKGGTLSVQWGTTKATAAFSVM
jgi:hypothetical protein